MQVYYHLHSHAVSSGIIQCRPNCLAPTSFTLFYLGELFQALSVDSVVFADVVKFVATNLTSLTSTFVDSHAFNMVQKVVTIEMKMPLSVINV